MSDSPLIERISAADPYGPGTELPVDANSPDVAIVEIRRRISMSSEGNPSPAATGRSWRGPALALASFVIVLIIGSVLFFTNDGDPTVDTTVPPTTEATTTTSPTTTTSSTTTTTTEAAAFDDVELAQFSGNWEFGGDTWSFIVFGDGGWFTVGLGDSVVDGSIEQQASQVLFNWGPAQPLCDGLTSRFNVDFDGNDSFRLVNVAGPCDEASDFEGAVFTRSSQVPDPGFYEPAVEPSAACLAVADEITAQFESIFDRGDVDPASVDWQGEPNDAFGAMQAGIVANCEAGAAGHVVSEFLVFATLERASRTDIVVDRINILVPGLCATDIGLTPEAQAACQAG